MKHKGLIFTIAFVLWHLYCGNLWASPTTAYQAEKVVAGWLKTDSNPLDTFLGQQVKDVEIFTNDSDQPIYYIVYLQHGGFVIVPADDLLEPIIAFVEKGVYDPSMDNPLGALVTNDLKGRIEAVRNTAGPMEQTLRQNTKTALSKWDLLIGLADADDDKIDLFSTRGIGTGDMDDVRIAPLIETQWDQGTAQCGHWCYNKYTPNHWPSGCVATALAQIMRYYEYPDTGIGTNSFSIKVNGITQPWSTRGGDGSGGVYDWANMVSVPSCTPTEAQLAAIGAICYDAGVGISNLCANQYTNYTSTVTIAYTCSARAGLTSTFKYGNAIYGYSGSTGSSIPSANRNKMINPNLDGGHPVYLGIWKTGADYGHAIVCDGYGYDSGTLYHHLNMGWGGDDNAWYNLPTINSSPDYNTVYETIYNIRPTVGNNGEMISGRIFDPNGVPLANPFVYADPSEEPPVWIPSSKSWNNGIYAFDNLKSNKTYSLHPLVTGYVFTSQNVATGTSTNSSMTVGNVWGVDFYGEPFEITNITPSSGPIGSYIKIEGQNFGSSAGTVIFSGGDGGEEVQWSDTIIYCRVPDNAQSGDVKIATAESDLSFGMYFEITTPNPVYVDDNTGQIEDGTPEYPLGRIQTGIQAVAADGIVIVNPGTYYENINFNGRNITLTSTDPNDPDVVASTIIDGSQADTVVTFSSGENTNCRLRGFTITNGYSEWDGGGIYCEHSSPTITRCVIRNNTSDMGGGGIKCYDYSSTVITYCTVTANSVGASQSGGGIYCLNDSDAIISGCTISDNTCGYGGAGMYINSSRPELTGCTFTGNFMTDEYTYGGAINNYNSSPTLTGCRFINNSASWEAGAVYNNWDCCPILINCTFINNFAGESGGAVSNISSAKPKLINCSFLGNRAGARGGAIYSFYSNQELTITNCRFAGNVITKSGSDGGAIYNDSSGPAITNCTFSDNFAQDKGGAVYNSFNNYGSNGNMTAANCIFWGNAGNGQIYDYYSTTVVTYCDVQNGWTGTSNINTNPLFTAPGCWVDVNDPNIVVEANEPNALWVDGDYRLELDSLCIDAGSNDKIPPDTYDIDGNANTVEPLPWDLDRRSRVADGDCTGSDIVDIGAYEFGWSYIGDFAGGCDVDFRDFTVLAMTWLSAKGDLDYNSICDISIPADDLIDVLDLRIFVDNWLISK